MMPSGHQLREAQREPGGGQVAMTCRRPPLRLPVSGMETARGRRVGSQPPQLGQEVIATPAAQHDTGGSLGVSMGGTSCAPFRAPTGGTVQGDKIPLDSFHTVEAAGHAHDGRAAATTEACARRLGWRRARQRTLFPPARRPGHSPRRACSRPAAAAAL
jgi:hypothetical protein